MGFVPNTTIALYRGVPLDNSYENTFYFSTTSQQTSYFNSLSTTVVLNENYRVEPNRESIKVQMPYASVFNCNYMRFKNTSYENKWFYAFITAVEYVNEETTRISYEIDVLQTWLPGSDYILESCFVEREHTSDDSIGANLEPESLDLGQMVTNGLYERELNLDDGSFETGYWHYYLVAIAEASSHIYNRIYNGAKLYAFNSRNEINAMQSFLSSFSEAPQKILGVYAVPSMAISSVDQSTHELLEASTMHDFDLNGVNDDTDLDTYIPRNKKLLTYPFNALEIVSPDGSTMTLAYEFFRNTFGIVPPTIRAQFSALMPVQVIVRPYRYCNTESSNGDYENKLSLSNFPVCCWTNDAYREYLANGMVKTLSNGATSIVNSVARGAIVGAIGGSVGAGGAATISATTSLIGTIASLATETHLAKLNNVSPQGNSSTSNADFANRGYHFMAYRKSVNRQRARIIDDYFQMYGYATNKVKVPSTHSRSKWTYTKTIGCNLKSSNMPVEHMRKVEDIFDAGVRFWSDHSSIGNYDQSNPVLSSVN